MSPGWLLFREGCPGGENPEQVGARVDRGIARARAANGDTALFAHARLLRVLVARWIGSPAGAGQHFLLRSRSRPSAIRETYFRYAT
jgi:broad specificity phosphatase PhoE